jgi:hypothetical protein
LQNYADGPPTVVRPIDRRTYIAGGNVRRQLDASGAQEAHEMERGGARVPARHLEGGLRRMRFKPSSAERPVIHQRKQQRMTDAYQPVARGGTLARSGASGFDGQPDPFASREIDRVVFIDQESIGDERHVVNAARSARR